ncbi:MAG: SRPBCC domain-containing protein [Thermodesulfobacteriota bacterium]|nr:SRPBCC domain-containing protein [Thermodesulfobacteriota bacterium]
MREVYTEIDIHAPVAAVWRILVDLEAYREWNPFILESHGRAMVGERLVCRPALKTGKSFTFRPVVTRLVEEREFAWEGHVLMPGIADGLHVFSLVPLSRNRTRMVHRQTFSGLLIPFLWWRIAPIARQGFVKMNTALKARAESRGQTAVP